MSACSDSRTRVLTRAGLLASCFVLLIQLPAAAGVDRIHIRPGSVVVERSSDGDTTRIIRSEHRSLERDRRGGWIEVDDRGDALVRVFGDIHVPAGKRVDNDVVAVFGSVDIEGRVEGDVVAVLGSVHVREGAEVQGQAVSVGGTVDQEEGAVIQGQTVSVGFLPVSWGIPGLPFTLAGILVGWIAAVLAGWIFALVFPARLVRVAATASRRTGVSLLIGLLSLPGMVAGALLLLVTVLGIPLALLLPFAYVLLVCGGQIASTYVLGCKLVSRPIGSRGLMGPILAGTLLIAVFFGVGAVLFVAPGATRPLALFSALLGCLLVVALTTIGTGAFLLSRFGKHPQDVTWGPEHGASVPTPLPASPPAA